MGCQEHQQGDQTVGKPIQEGAPEGSTLRGLQENCGQFQGEVRGQPCQVSGVAPKFRGGHHCCWRPCLRVQARLNTVISGGKCGVFINVALLQ